jgi:hypothetical protein
VDDELERICKEAVAVEYRSCLDIYPGHTSFFLARLSSVGTSATNWPIVPALGGG